MLPANIGGSTIRQIFEPIVFPTQFPDDITSATVNIRKRVIIAARNEEIPFLILINTINVKEVPGVFIGVSMPFSSSIGFLKTEMLRCPPLK